MDAGLGEAGAFYRLVGSLGGIYPGIQLGTKRLALTGNPVPFRLTP